MYQTFTFTLLTLVKVSLENANAFFTYYKFNIFKITLMFFLIFLLKDFFDFVILKIAFIFLTQRVCNPTRFRLHCFLFILNLVFTNNLRNIDSVLFPNYVLNLRLILILYF